MSFALRIAALVFFILAALAAWVVSKWTVTDAVGFVSVGLGCWVASTFPFPAAP